MSTMKRPNIATIKSRADAGATLCAYALELEAENERLEKLVIIDLRLEVASAQEMEKRAWAERDSLRAQLDAHKKALEYAISKSKHGYRCYGGSTGWGGEPLTCTCSTKEVCGRIRAIAEGKS